MSVTEERVFVDRWPGACTDPNARPAVIMSAFYRFGGVTGAQPQDELSPERGFCCLR